MRTPTSLARALRAPGAGRWRRHRPHLLESPRVRRDDGGRATAGLRLTPINWHLTGEEAAYIVADCEARAVVADAGLGRVATGAVEGGRRVQRPSGRQRVVAGLRGLRRTRSRRGPVQPRGPGARSAQCSTPRARPAVPRGSSAPPVAAERARRANRRPADRRRLPGRRPPLVHRSPVPRGPAGLLAERAALSGLARCSWSVGMPRRRCG